MDRVLSYAALVMLGMLPAASCDTVGVEPRSPYPSLALPTFSIQPGSTADTSCANGVAFLASLHLTSLDVAFFQPDSTSPRQQCGAVAFDEVAPNIGRVEIGQSTLDMLTGEWESWARRLRVALSGDLAPDTFLAVKQITPDDTIPLGDYFEFDAPAEDANDLIYFAWRHAATSAEAVDTTTEVNAAAQLWRFITAPDSFAVDSIDETPCPSPLAEQPRRAIHRFHPFVGAPLLGPDGTVYTFTSCDFGREPNPCSDELIAFWEDKPVDPDSPWPMWRHDARRSGQAHK